MASKIEVGKRYMLIHGHDEGPDWYRSPNVYDIDLSRPVTVVRECLPHDDGERRWEIKYTSIDAKGQEPVGYVSETAMILITGGGYEGVNLRKHRGSKSFSNAWGQDIPLYTHPANVAALEAENASLREQLAKARKDTERLDWLSKKSLIAVWDRNEKALSPNKVCDYVFVNYGSPDAWHDLLRFQVDSAMKQSEGESP